MINQENKTGLYSQEVNTSNSYLSMKTAFIAVAIIILSFVASFLHV